MSHSSRSTDGSAGDADYVSIGTVYRNYRVADSRIAVFVHAALGDAHTVLNIGAGTGSYEPTDRLVTAVEPSATMRERRPPHFPPAVDAYAEQLPFPNSYFDAAMGTFTVHQWADLTVGLAEVRRVTRGPVVFLTCDPALLRTYWLYEYSPEAIETEASRYPQISALAAGLGGVTKVTPVPIPLDCTQTASMMPTMVAQKCCSTRPPVWHAQRGALSTPQRSPDSRPGWLAT